MRLPVRSQINNRMSASTPLLSNESGILKASVGKLQGLDRDEKIEIILISKRRIRAVVRNQSKSLQHSVLNPGFSKHMINKPEFFHHDFQALAVHPSNLPEPLGRLEAPQPVFRSISFAARNKERCRLHETSRVTGAIEQSRNG